MPLYGTLLHRPDKHINVGCRIYHSTTQSINTGTVTPLAFDTEDFDTNGFHDTVTNNSRVTIPTGLDGFYLILGHVQYAAQTTGERRARIHKNGSVVIQNNKMTVTVAAEVTNIQCVAVLNLVATDYIELNAYHTQGSALNVTGTAASSQLIAIYLGKAA